MSGPVQRDFSDGKYHSGEWNTSVSFARNPVVRAAWAFLSQKRAGVDRLARQATGHGPVLDLGCGAGAYAHWFLGRKPAGIVALDWSLGSLRTMRIAPRGRIHRVCADARFLPFAFGTFEAIFSIDTLGHIPRADMVLDECLRVARPGCALFLHSECADYRRRLPDRALISRTGEDRIARLDGHDGLRLSKEIRAAYAARFLILFFICPAGVLGWLLGYPEKYRLAFSEANLPALSALVSVFAWIKATPLLGGLLRIVNACCNHIELAIGLSGGGSCFSDLRKPGDTARREA